MNILAKRTTPPSQLEVSPGLIENLRERRDQDLLVAADRLATQARRKTFKQSVKASWANVKSGVGPLLPGQPYRVLGLIQPAHQISDEDFDRQVSDILDMRHRAARTA